MSLQETVFKKALTSLLSTTCKLAFGDNIVSSKDFVNEALAKSIIQIEYAKFALKRSDALALQHFANEAISFYSSINTQIIDLANKKNITTLNKSELIIAAEKIILEHYKDAFEETYASDQIEILKEMIELFQSSSIRDDDGETKQFIENTLPAIQEFFQASQKIYTKIHAQKP
ncbi:MAG: DUF4142 domain-containing protein [Sphingobacteriales bacterium]|nr:MAG: DUF4142 domain-containing protein [Sphingobacteriales bacterium]